MLGIVSKIQNIFAGFPAEIKFHTEAWQDARLIQRGAFMIVERLATLGDAGFNMSPEEGAGM